MGTWDVGILDNDTALDGLSEVTSEVAADVVRFGALAPSKTSTDKLAAAVAVLLELSVYEHHAAQIAQRPRAQRAILKAVAGGGGKAIAERPAKMGAEAIAALSAHAPACPFGKRERSLFDSKAGAAYVARVAKRCIALVDQDFAHPENWSNLAREGIGIGGLAPLLVLDPCVVPTKKVDRWRRAAKEGLAALEAAPDGELDYHRQYYASLDTVLALLVKRADKHAS